jgi:hypothetical protein
MTTRLYRQYCEEPATPLAADLKSVWQDTPWIIDVDTGVSDGARCREIFLWCHANLGVESDPWRGKPGRWRRSNATVFGRTWFGFATEADMRLFQSVWGGDL